MTGEATVTARQSAERWSSWQAMDSGRLLLLAAAGMLTVAAIAHSATVQVVAPHPAVAFGVLIALGELLRLALPGGREAAPIATAGAMAYALLLYVGQLPGHGKPIQVSPLQVIAVAAIANDWWLAATVMTVLVVFGSLVDAVIGALIRADDLGARFGVALWDEMRVQWPLGAAVGASAMIIVFAAETMGIAGLAVFVVPLLVTQLAFRRYAGIRSTYLQTVRALARVTEVGGYVEGGHSRRVSVLAVAVGRELGMSEPDLLDLEYAALMHDIGQLSLRDPIPGGATVLVSRPDQQRIAMLGADVIAKAGVLDRVAELVRCQSLPARGSNPEPPVGSRIIRAANAFDDLVGASADRDRSVAALERLRLDTAYEYDAGVVEALSEVAGRRRFSRL